MACASPKTMNSVAYWTNIPAPYVVERFNALARRGNLDFQAWFSAAGAPDRSWEVDESAWEFSFDYLPRLGGDRHGIALPATLLRRDLPQLVVGLHADPAMLLGYPVLRLRGARTAFWVMKTYESWVRRRPWKDAVKRAAFSRVDGIMTTGDDGRSYALGYGARPERIFVLPHFVDFEHFSSQASVHRPARTRIRAELGLRGLTFIYVGRLWRGKGLDHLLSAFAELKRQVTEPISLLLVGDGVDEERFRRRCREERLDDVIFAGFRQRAELPVMYAAADVLVFPTLGDPFGHVVEEAMSSGLPVIATQAAGEIRTRVLEGETGFVVPPGRPDTLLARMRLLVTDDNLRARMGRAAVSRVSGQTGDAWAQAFESAVRALMRGAG